MYNFFEWYIINNCLDDDSKSSTINYIDYSNPIKKISLTLNKNETMRNSLPTRYLKMLEDIIIEDDFSWAKRHKRDWITIKGKKVWNPVTTYLILLKLKLPIRTYQLRYLDSGEADKYVFNYSKWKWESNTHIATKENTQQGVLRRILDNNTHKEFVGLDINTNKTNDINKDDNGYVIPWENRDVIKIISSLIEWQKKYNPILNQTKWIEIDDIQLRKKSKQQLKDLGSNVFLFRDLFNNNSNYPVLDTRIQSYWKRLLAELEKRINSQVKESENIKFIEKWIGKTPKKTYYDLHSLRVTNLTALYQAGVPYSILSKYIAGHASILMTIYYTKFNVTHISDVLNKATKKIEQKEQQNFNEFIANKSYEEIKDNIVFNNQSSMQAITQLNKGNYMSSDIGICPVGENKCDEGGELLTSENINHKIYGPVPNGPKNCLRCRFFITGIPFLLGLTARFNELSIEIKDKVIIFRQSEENYEQLYSQRYKKEKEGEAFTKWKDLEIADSNYNKHNNELDQILINWQSLYTLIEQCLAIKNKEKNNSDKLSLVTVGNFEDLNMQLSECSDFELYDNICQSSVFYQSIQPNVANIKRGRIINKMLMYNNMQPSFVLLDEKESLSIGNEFVKILMLKIGKPNALDVMNEKKKLSDFGISLEVEQDIQKLLKNKYEFKNKQLVKATDE